MAVLLQPRETFVVLLSTTAVFCAVLCCGCTSTSLIHPKSRAEMNAQLDGRNAIIKLKDGKEWDGENVNVLKDSVSFLNQDTNSKSSIAIQEIDRIATISRDHVIGGLEGMGIGYVGATLAIWSLSGFSTEEAGNIGGSHFEWAAFFGLAGAPVGLIIGAIVGFTYYDEFQLDMRTDEKNDATNSPDEGADTLHPAPSVVALETPKTKYSSDSLCDSCSTTWDERPGQIHDVMILTNIGAYYLVLPADQVGIRGVADFAALFIVNGFDAVGGSLFASSDGANLFNVGAEFRYRRRIDSRRSLDFGIGMPIFGESSLCDGTISFYGLAKWNPVPWLGIALRPELRRKGGQIFEYVWPGNGFVTIDDPYRLYVSLGIEIGGRIGR